VDYLPPLRPTTPRGSTAAAVVLSVEPLVLQVAGPSLPVMVEPPPPEPPAPAPSDLRVTSPPAMQPVGKPILLLATVLGADGRPLPDAAVEWTIERQGVGEIRGVADDPRLGKPGDKRSPTFARSYTCNRGHRLRLAGDDQRQIDVAAGDAWCLVDSLQPGDMQLTVRSPDVTARPTAVTLRTHWRSAEAVFPSAKDALVVGPTVLETFVRETVGAAPLAGYRVRYRWKNPPVEAGGETIVATMEALTDADGRAAFRLPPPDLDPRQDWTLGPAGTVTRKPIAIPDDTPAAPPNRIVPKVQAPGRLPTDRLPGAEPPILVVTTVAVELLGPQSAPGPAVVLAKGECVVRWRAPPPAPEASSETTKAVGANAPPIELKAAGSTIAPVAAWTNLTVTTTTSLDGAAGDWRLRVYPPAGVEASDVQGKAVGDRTEENAPTVWTLAVRSTTPGVRRVRFELRQADVTRARGWADVDFVEPRVTVAKTAPTKYMLGRPTAITLRVENTGKTATPSLRLVEELPNHTSATADGVVANGAIVWRLDPIPPGAHREVTATVTVDRPTAGASTWTRVEWDGKTLAESAAPFEAAGVAALVLRVRDRRDPIPVGEVVEYTVELTNRGTASARRIVLETLLSPGATVVAAEGDLVGSVGDGAVELGPIGELEIGATATARLRIKGAKAGDQRLTVRATHESTGPTGLVAGESTIVYDADRP
ncbi:MAG: hypothetical protein ACRC1K_05610, partial [Planctomycetia bacterium]